SSSSAWTKVGTYKINSSGSGSHTKVRLGFSMQANTLYGIYIRVNSSTLNYTNGVGSGNDTMYNSDMVLRFGDGVAGLFSGSNFNPRIWNGTLYYSKGGCKSGRVKALALINGTS